MFFKLPLNLINENNKNKKCMSFINQFLLFYKKFKGKNENISRYNYKNSKFQVFFC